MIFQFNMYFRFRFIYTN